MSRRHLISEQKCDQSLKSLFELVVSEEKLAEMATGYFVRNDVSLMLNVVPGVNVFGRFLLKKA